MRTALTLTPWTTDWMKNFDNFFDASLTPARFVDKPQAWIPSVDVEETEAEYKVSLDVPGIPKENIKVEFHDGSLHISGERAFESEKKEGTKHIVERQKGKFERTFLLGNEVDADKVQMEFCL